VKADQKIEAIQRLCNWLEKFSPDSARDMVQLINKEGMSVDLLDNLFDRNFTPQELNSATNKIIKAGYQPGDTLRLVSASEGFKIKLLEGLLDRGLVPTKIKTAMDSLAEAGYTPDTALDLFDFAQTHGVIIRARPTNPDAPKLRNAGLPPKPDYVKTKTVNEADTYLGATGDQLGQAAYFEPHLDEADIVHLPENDRNKIRARYQERLEEYQKQAQNIQNEIDRGRIQMRDGDILVYDTITELPFTGDIDIFDILSLDGNPIPLEGAKDLMEILMRIVDDVQHGHHMDPDWGVRGVDPDETKVNIKESIINRHSLGSNNPELLVDFNANGTIERSLYGGDNRARVPYGT
jgi:hypothetical protein